jgi:tRNA-2-methylthio-N6-dimethylallyladenosine synthase
MQTFHIRTFGCQMNEADSQEIREMLLSLGLTETENWENADLVLVNTCSVRKKAEEKAFSFIGETRAWREADSGRRLAVMGCIAARDPDGIRRRFEFVDAIIPGKDLDAMKKSVRDILPEDLALLPHLSGYPASNHGSSPVVGMVSVIRGCNNACSFCIVPYVRGREVSVPPEKVVDRVARLVEGGSAEIYLLGQSILDYGKEWTPPFLLEDLLAKVASEVPGLRRLRFITSHPKDVTRRLVEAVRDIPLVAPYFHIPFQSGSDKILERMRRDITVQQYYETVDLIRSTIPSASISTDIIVGFPGETDEDFEGTMEVVERVRFDGAFVFKYSPREHTLARLKWGDPVPPTVKSQRFIRLYNRVKDIVFEKNREKVGTIGEVLVEGARDGMLYGRLADYRMTHFRGPPEWIGQLIPVRIESAQNWSLRAVALSEHTSINFSEARPGNHQEVIAS